eukprot:CAMPEP_0181329110 /NCGR_PEP_ID=MMETSP1101-20121128/23123_1 /TAXON_ID=46948 /ORGANISM="Rhodomonas abbreviata, Strain Caron Lab Isolate" /LENGTH=524 /DNA_ID=CAMNT_0023438141 /DNA_START=97 /DNA_END=1667 /DNA_ORIENTATION=-
MGRTGKAFIDKKNATVYRLVHPTDEGGNPIPQDGVHRGTLAKVGGEKNYFSDDDAEEYPYREDSSGDEADEEEAGARRKKPEDEYEVEEEWEEEEDCGELVDDFEDGLPLKQNWRRTDEDAQSEYSSWSQRTASSYLNPERRKQLWKDIEEFGLEDDGYDYTQHLRNPGGGIRLSSHMPTELAEALHKKAARMLSKAPKAAREVIALLEDSEEEDAPPLDEGEEQAANEDWLKEGERLIDDGVVVEEGDELPDDFALRLNEDREDDEDQQVVEGPPRPSRLLDEQFDYFMQQYADDQIGELDDEVGYTPQNGEVHDEAYYYALLRSYVNGTAMPGGDVPPDEGEIILERPPAWVDLEEEQDDEIAAKTKAMALKEDSSEESMEEVEVEEKEQWDCESIISTYSNIYNHPKTIADSRSAIKITIDPRTGVPILNKDNALEGEKKKAPAHPKPVAEDAEEEADEEDEDEESSSRQAVQVPGARERGESAEEKKARKEAAKAVRAQARQKKKDKAEARASARPRAPA